MRIVLQVLEEIDLHPTTVSRQVVACKVNKHYVFSILLRVVTQILRILLVLFAVASTSCCSCYRVYVSPVALNATVCFRRGAEDTEPSEVEVEKIRRGIYAPQRPVEIEVVALIALNEPA